MIPLEHFIIPPSDHEIELCCLCEDKLLSIPQLCHRIGSDRLKELMAYRVERFGNNSSFKQFKENDTDTESD